MAQCCCSPRGELYYNKVKAVDGVVCYCILALAVLLFFVVVVGLFHVYMCELHRNGYLTVVRLKTTCKNDKTYLIREGMGRIQSVATNGNLHDFRSAWRVRFRSLCIGRGVAVLVAVFTSDSSISSSPSVKLSSRPPITETELCPGLGTVGCEFMSVTGDAVASPRRRRQVNVPLISTSSPPGPLVGVPSSVLTERKDNLIRDFTFVSGARKLTAARHPPGPLAF